MRPVPVLAAAAAALACLLGWEVIAEPEPLPGPVAVQVAVPPARAPDPLESDADSVENFAAAALARPLFRQDRRPPAADSPDAAPEEPPRLTGIIIGPNGRRAIFEDPSGRSKVAAPGDRVGRFTVAAIAPGQVSLTASEGERVLRPSHTKRTETPGTAAGK
jgi:hypothetical protein